MTQVLNLGGLIIICMAPDAELGELLHLDSLLSVISWPEAAMYSHRQRMDGAVHDGHWHGREEEVGGSCNHRAY